VQCDARGPKGRDPDFVIRVDYETRTSMRRMSPSRERLEEGERAARGWRSAVLPDRARERVEMTRRQVQLRGDPKEARDTTRSRSSPNVQRLSGRSTRQRSPN
jgi:hypothetical protein